LKSEAEYHSLDEYMKHAENYFIMKEFQTGHKLNRTVFLASDDPTVFQEAVKTLNDSSSQKKYCQEFKYFYFKIKVPIVRIHV
jgi:hypothetical protein